MFLAALRLALRRGVGFRVKFIFRRREEAKGYEKQQRAEQKNYQCNLINILLNQVN